MTVPPGRIEAIFIAADRGAPMQSVAEARAVAGRGLVGDRYYANAGSLSRWAGPKRELTLISTEALEELNRQGVPLTAADSRRNVLVSGIELNALVKQRIRLGEIDVKGVRLCQPCKYLERKTGITVLPAMIGRGGLRVQILSDGLIRVGDPVDVLG
ncbi:MAG: MOSC domain-containing protein [Rhodothermales bacterium]|nr:MOSC domain-containing protein [Rhodothermales bacterium]MBO6780329.1 MOSC domain-containing protein [Rhodothermales bacterium]